MPLVKSKALKAAKSAARKQKKGVSSGAALMQRKVKQTFAAQVEAFTKRYRHALEALGSNAWSERS
jgi:hypothetical protein